MNSTRLDYAPPQPPSHGRELVKVVGIAATIVVGLFMGLVLMFVLASDQKAADARLSAAATDVSNIGTALDAFCIDADRYPTTAEGLNALIMPPHGIRSWRGPYLKRVPTDPWQHPYVYRSVAGSYRILSVGPDGKVGTADDIAAPLSPPAATTQATSAVAPPG